MTFWPDEMRKGMEMKKAMTSPPNHSLVERLREAERVELQQIRRAGGDRTFFELFRDAADRITALEEALRFYADPYSAKDEIGEPILVPDFYGELDFGDTARRALGAEGERR